MTQKIQSMQLHPTQLGQIHQPLSHPSNQLVYLEEENINAYCYRFH